MAVAIGLQQVLPPQMNRIFMSDNPRKLTVNGPTPTHEKSRIFTSDSGRVASAGSAIR